MKYRIEYEENDIYYVYYVEAYCVSDALREFRKHFKDAVIIEVCKVLKGDWSKY